nr:ROK family protein [Janthinobacterium lividum]
MEDGYLRRGGNGAAGNVGHIRVPGHDDVICHCENIGCIEAVASMHTVMQKLSQTSGRPIRDAADLADSLTMGNHDAVRLIRDAAREIGEVITMQVHAFNPAAIVLGGSMARISDDLLAAVRAVDFERALPFGTRSLVIESSIPGEYTGVAGSAILGVENTLSLSGITRLMRVKF